MMTLSGYYGGLFVLSAGMIFMQLRKSALLLLLMAAAGRLSAQQPLQTIFSGWELTCDNYSVCQGRNTDAGAGLVVSFYYPSGQGGIAWLRIDDRGYPPVAETQPLILRLVAGEYAWPTEGMQSNTYSVLFNDPLTAQKVLEALSQAPELKINENQHQVLDLESLPAFLSKVTQVRNNLRSAESSSAESLSTLVVEPAPQIPTPLSENEMNAFINYGISQIGLQSCPLEPVFRQIKAEPVSDSQALLLMSCENAAYNTFYHAWLIDRHSPSRIRQLRFRLPFSAAGLPVTGFELTNVLFDPQTGTLTTVLWGRSLGDCGTMSRWQFDGQQFLLKHFASESVCDRWHPMKDWPVLWSATPAEENPAAGEGL